jgi:N-acetylneuraminic acid mutarotase
MKLKPNFAPDLLPARQSLGARRSMATVRGMICALACLIAAGSAGSCAGLATPPPWTRLAALPDREGFAGSFAGVSGGALLVAGGANFPNAKPWEGGAKAWYDTVFVLDTPDGVWRHGGALPCPLGYGVSVSHRRGLVCIGGSDARQHHASVLVLKWDAKAQRLQVEPLLGLLEPQANMCGALVGDTVFVCGGTASPDSTNALNTLFSMNLSPKRPGWRKLDPLPGPGRMLAVAGAHDGSLYVFGGAALHAGADGKPARDYLREAWRYTPGKGWKRLRDLPRAVVAAPSPAPVVNGKFLILGGDDGTQVTTPPAEHKGFPRDVLAYDPKTDRWERLGELPFSLVTTATAVWEKRVVIPGGEIRPGTRSPEVWAMPSK